MRTTPADPSRLTTDDKSAPGSPAPLALITGGGGELARAIAVELGDAGYEVLCPGREALDVGDSESVARYFRSERLAGLELLVNNAGVTRDRLAARMDEADWDAVQDVNLRGAFLCSRAAAVGMIRRRLGHIINIGSFSALDGPVGQANYAAAKAGLIGLTLSLASELGPRNIRVNAVLPGFLETKLTATVTPERREDVRARHVLGRFNTVSEAATFVGFLHRRMPHTSGQVFRLDSRRARW